MARIRYVLLSAFLFLAPVSAVFAQTVTIVPGLPPVVSASAEATHVLKATPGTLYYIHVENATATVGYVLVQNTATAATSGAVTPSMCVRLPVSAGVDVPLNAAGLYLNTAISVTLSSNASCFTVTTGTITGFISAIVQ